MVLVPSATAGGVPLVLARLVEGLSTHQCAGGPWRLEDRRNCSQVSPCAGRLPSGRGPNADRPSMSWATSTARRIAAATWIMSSTTVASRAYAVVPAKRSRWSRGGAYRPRSAPAAGSARHRADAGRRDRAARSPDPQPASCRRSFRRGYRARAAPSTRHHWRPRPDRQPVPGCVGRDVLAGACVPTSGPAGAVPVRVRSRSSAGLRWRRGRLWHPRRQHRPLRTGPGSGDRCEGRRFAPLARRIYVPGILSSQPSQVCPPAHGTVPERRANVQKGARPRGTDRRYSVPFRGSAGRRKDAGTRWLGCCPPEMSTGETHPRAKRPMNRAKTPLRRRAAPPARSKIARIGDSPYGVVCITSHSLTTSVLKNGIGRVTNVASLSVLTPHSSVVASAGGNRYVTRFRVARTFPKSSSPRKSCQLTYTSVVLDWHRATSVIGLESKPPTPSVACRTDTTVVESSSGFVERLTIQSSSSADASSGSPEVTRTDSTASSSGTSGSAAPTQPASSSSERTTPLHVCTKRIPSHRQTHWITRFPGVVATLPPPVPT